MNYEDIKKPAYYAFKFMNELGNKEYASTDADSYVCKDSSGNVRVLFWDCTIDHANDTTNDQQFYNRVIPAKPASAAKLKLTGLKPGKYSMEIYRTGFKVNDPFTYYMSMGSPAQLTRKQVAELKQQNSGAPSEQQIINISADGKLEKEFTMRQNDVYFVKLNKL